MTMGKILKGIIIVLVFMLLFNLSFIGCQKDKGGKETGTATGTEKNGTFKVESENIIYVATDGNDTNPGTMEKPLRTIQKAADLAKAGDTVYVRGGTYSEKITVNNSGTKESIITISAYPGEKAVLDGENRLPEGEQAKIQWTPLLLIKGDYVQFKDFTVINSRGRGVQAGGEHVTFSNLEVSHIYNSGVNLHGRYGVVEDSEFYDISYVRLSGANAPSAVHVVDSYDCIVRRNYVHDVHMEGIGILRAYNSVVEYNVIVSTGAVTLYLDNAVDPLVQGNILYRDEDMLYGSSGIMIADEDYPALGKAIGRGAVIINNMVYNCSTGFNFWRGERRDSALIDVLVSNNTFINITKTGINIDPPFDKEDSNTVIENNIVHVKTGAKLVGGNTTPYKGITFRNNCWSGAPGGWWSDSDDIYGNPGLLMGGPVYQPEFYKLTESSPCIDKAIPESAVAEDAFQNKRDDKPDIGASEFQGTKEASGTVPSPAAALLDVKETDSFFDYVNILLANNIVSAYPDNTFKPQDSITADEVIKMIVEAVRLLDDIEGKTGKAEDHIVKAKELNIITGTEFTDYANSLSRGELIPIIAKSSLIRGEGNPSNVAQGKTEIKNYSSIKPAWANFLLQIYAKGIVGLSSNGEYDVNKTVTRAEAAEIIAKFFDPALRVMPKP